MKTELVSHWALINNVTENPSLLEDRGVGAGIARDLALALLAVADDSIDRRNAAPLDHLAKTAAITFNSYNPPDGPAVDFVDISEYMSLVEDCIDTSVDPRVDDYLRDYRADIEAALLT